MDQFIKSLRHRRATVQARIEEEQDRPAPDQLRLSALKRLKLRFRDQIEFIELIVSELTTNGVMEAGRLYESPFLDISPQGPEGLFPVAKVDRMVQVLDEIRQRAAA